jgi:pimeloyl-ACP methyl ester carboxylesterase
MDRAASFVRVERHLPGRHVVRFDRRGYGRSVGAGVAASFDDHVDDLLGVIDGRTAAVVGHSLGGVIALAAAERRPDLVRAVGAFESPRPWTAWWPRDTAGGEVMLRADAPEDAAEAFMRRMIGDERWDGLPERTRRERRAEGPALVAEMRFLQAPPGPYDPARIEVPVVVARGGESTGHHRRTADELASLVAGAELVEIAGALHGAHVSHPAAFAGYVERVVALAGGGGRSPGAPGEPGEPADSS